MKLPEKCVVDTNVPKTANLAYAENEIPKCLVRCVMDCIEAVEHITGKKGLIIDAGNEIFNEYLDNLCLSGQRGVGNGFLKWVHDNIGILPSSHRVNITKNGESYDEFPKHRSLNDFDRSDRKSVAVSNAHPDKPPILQATDSKWWGWKDALEEVGIKVIFLCPKYVEKKYEKKMKK